MATIPAARRHDLTDAQWAVLEPLLPKGKRPGRPPKWDKRQLIDGNHDTVRGVLDYERERKRRFSILDAPEAQQVVAGQPS